MFKKLFATTAALALFVSQVEAASVPTFPSPWDPGNALGILNTWVTQSLNPNVSNATTGTPRNLLNNGEMAVNQRSVTATCATTSGVVELSYSADQWACDVNMVTGAGQLAVTTSSPTPPIGYINQSTLVRNSGSLLQPECAWQEIPKNRATDMAGAGVVLSAYMAALAGLAADNGGSAFLVLATGTGADQGLGALRSAVGMTTTVKQSSFTISTTTGLITNASTVVAGQAVSITAATMPAGITSGQVYYVSSALLNSGTAFAIAPTYAQAIAGTGTLIPTSAGTTNVINVPAITPVWTGLAVYGANNAGAGQLSVAQGLGQTISQSFPITTSYGRVSTGVINVPANVTEAAVGVCFTPISGAGGSTDGIAFTGVQLEIVGAGQTSPTLFEFRPYTDELLYALRYAWIVPEPNNNVGTSFQGFYSTTTNCELGAQLPVPMDVIPTLSWTGGALSATTWKIVNGGGSAVVLASTFLVTSSLSTPGLTSVHVAATTGASTAGWGCQLVGAAGGSIMNIGADF